jgi:preprotein translocase subunit SecD
VERMGTNIQQRALVIIAVIIGSILCLLPTILRDNLTSKWFTKPIALGLDISGGVHLVYGVKAREAVTSRLQALLAGARAELRGKKIAVAQSQVSPDGSIQIALLSDASLDTAKQVITEKSPELSLVSVENEGGRPRLRYQISEQAAKKIEAEAIEQAVETLRNRVDQFGVSEPLIQRSGENRIILQMPGVSDINAVKKVVGSVAKLEFRLVPSAATAQGVGTTSMRNKAGQTVVVEDQALMTGDAVSDARVDFDPQGQVEVSLKLSSLGAQTFSRITAENVGRQLAIILDGVVYSAPVIRDAITGGNASISGGFTVEEARQLKVVLKAGALPAPLEVLEERTVGPTLGKESVKKGLLAMAVGFSIISLFMMFYYLKSGVVAVGTLILNAVVMVACLSLFGATLTLPGLAGLALTIGMAVDSNVIIFERIRDEIRNGASRNAAVAAGFDKAFGAIFDANVTTLLAGVLLYYFGTGAIRGFAVTLSVGVLTTLFCAVFVARLCFDAFSIKGKQGLSI